MEKNDWLFGNNISLPDFIFVELIERLITMETELDINTFRKYSSLKKYFEKFINLPNIKSFRKSDEFFDRPYHATFTPWY